MPALPTVLELDDLATGFPHIPPTCGEWFAQAAVVSLESQSHASGVCCKVSGCYGTEFRLCWQIAITPAMQRFWNDAEETVEQAAYGVALLLVRALTGYTVVERARRGTGFDWWLGTDDNLFQAKARLEVSGILCGTARRMNRRVKEKLEQTRRSDARQLPAYVVVMEFGSPQAKVAQR